MSLTLKDSGIDCYARSGMFGQGMFEGKVSVGDHEIEIGDFCDMVIYVLTNTDLAYGDEREALVDLIKNMEKVTGYNGGNMRFRVKGENLASK